MRTTRIIETSVQINNPIEFAQSDDSILQLLTAKFGGRVLRGLLIISIIRVLRRSECVITKHDRPTYGTMVVQFEAETVEYLENEPITDAKIIKGMEAGTFAAKTQYASVMIFTGEHRSAAESFTVGQYVPCATQKARCFNGTEVLAVMARLYLAPTLCAIFNVRGGVAEDGAVAAARGRLAAELEALAAVPRDRVEKIAGHITRAKKPITDGNFSDVNLSGLLAIDPRAGYLAEIRHFENTDEFPEEHEIVHLSNIAAVVALLHERATRVRFIRELAELHTAESMAAHSNIWKFYDAKKI